MFLRPFLFVGGVIACCQSQPCDAAPETACESANDAVPTDISRLWGYYTPYYTPPVEGISSEIPPTCRVTYASILSRHGSRFPTKNRAAAYKELVERIQANVTQYGPGFEFIKDYNYTLGVANLTTYGENELLESGRTFYERYQQLADEERSSPFVRAGESDRVIMSAQRFISGFYAAKGENDTKALSELLTIREGIDSNNTLQHGTCKPFEDNHARLADEAADVWEGIFARPIMDYLNQNMPGANLTLNETVAVMDLCPFNTAANDNGDFSQFCDLFSEQEWEQYDYYQSINKWYEYGPGNPLAPTQGVGYVNELIARLTRSPVVDRTSVNHTLASSPVTFPPDRRIYADFSHDNQMMTIYGALGLWTNDTQVPTDQMRTYAQTDGFSASRAVPFGARMFVETMVCEGDQRELIRVLVNERVVPPSVCSADELGRCDLQEFLDGLTFAKSGGDWDKCW